MAATESRPIALPSVPSFANGSDPDAINAEPDLNATRASHANGKRHALRPGRGRRDPKWQFLRGFLKHPVMVGSVIPSSRILIDKMLKPVDWSACRLFVEYGPGVGTFTRPILDRLTMGIEPFMVASTLSAVLAQRLVRVICPHCKEEYAPEQEYAGITLPPRLYRGRGCDKCFGLGSSGRTGIYELLLIDSELCSMIIRRTPA